MVTTTTQTSRTKEHDATKTPAAPDFMAMWEAAAKAQRAWLGSWMQPMGMGGTMTPEQMWTRWQRMSTECLDQAERSASMMKDFITDEVRLARELSDKTVEMARDHDKDVMPMLEPGFTREWLDTSRRVMERTFQFSTESMKAAEQFGRTMSDVLVKEPAAKG